MDFAQMTVTDKLDILYADAVWLNDDGTIKDHFEDLQHGNIGTFIRENKRLIENLLENDTQANVAGSLKIKTGTFISYVNEFRHSEGNENKPKRRRGRKSVDANLVVSLGKEKTIVEILQKEMEEIQEDICTTESLMKTIPKKKKLALSIGYLIQDYKDLEECENTPITETIDMDEVPANELLSVVENVEE